MKKGWSVSADWACCVNQLAVIEVRILSSCRIWETEALLPDDNISKEWLSGP